MGQGVLDSGPFASGPFAELGATLRGLLARPQLDQELFVGVDLDAAPPGAGGALGAQRAGLADAGGEAGGELDLPPGVNGIVTLLS
jgi:hypothetical protein